jgi:hypothetical protein
MAEKKRKASLSASNNSIVIGGDAHGSTVIAGQNINANIQTINVAPLFKQINDAVDKQAELKPAEKEDVKAELQEIKTEVEKPEPDESFLARRFRNIKRMSPEIVDVAIKTLQNPVGGVAEVIKRISKKMAEEAG